MSTGHFYTSLGNQLSGIAPSQILSVEHYFSDLSDFEFDFRLLKFNFLWRKDAQQLCAGFSLRGFFFMIEYLLRYCQLVFLIALSFFLKIGLF